MKTTKLYTLMATMLLFTAVGYGQQLLDGQVPEDVLSAFRQRFPAASSIMWTRNPSANYEAKFMMAENSQKAVFDRRGNWLETESPINKAALPQAISNAVMMQNNTCKISYAAEVQSVEYGKVFEVSCGKGGKKADYRVTQDGKAEKIIALK